VVRPRTGGFGGARERDLKVVTAERVKSKFQRGNREFFQIHLELEDIEGDWKNQHEWYGESETQPSAYWDFINQLVKLGALTEQEVDKASDVEELTKLVCKKIKGKEYHWEERRIGNKKSNSWVPVSEVGESSK